MNRGSESEILIVGAGPTGLTAAVELARRGIIPRVIDKKDKASTLSRAVGINPKTLHLLAESGVTEKLIEKGIKVRRGLFHAKDKFAFELDLALSPKPYDFLLALPQDQTEQILISRFGELGGTVEFDSRLESVSQTSESVSVSITSRGPTRDSQFQCVYGADGIRSTVRDSVGIGYEGIEVEDKWSIVDFDSETWPYRNELSLFLYGGGRVCLIVPIADGRYRGVADRPNGIDHMPSGLKIDNVRRTGDFSIWIKKAATMSKGEVFLGGDAAHSHSPVGGRGMNLGIADACEFAKRFAADELEGYANSRSDEVSATIRLTERGRFMATRSIPGKFAIMKYVLPLFLGNKRLHQRIVRTALDVSNPAKQSVSGQFASDSSSKSR